MFRNHHAELDPNLSSQGYMGQAYLLESFLKGGFHSNMECHDMFLKIISLLKNYRSEGGKSIHFWKALCTAFSKIPKSLPYVLQIKSYSYLGPESVVTHVCLLETYLLPHLLK